MRFGKAHDTTCRTKPEQTMKNMKNRKMRRRRRRMNRGQHTSHTRLKKEGVQFITGWCLDWLEEVVVL